MRREKKEMYIAMYTILTIYTNYLGTCRAPPRRPPPITARLRVLRPSTGALEALVVLGVMSAASRRSGHSRRKTLARLDFEASLVS